MNRRGATSRAKYDNRQTAWRITPSGREAISALVLGGSLKKSDWSTIGQDFQLALADVFALIEAEKQLGRNDEVPPGVYPGGYHSNDNGVGTFVEDTVRRCFQERLAEAERPEQMTSAAFSVAQTWLQRFADKRPSPPELLRWAGAGWKEIVEEQFEQDLRSFNTPSSTNIARITKQYVGADMTSVNPPSFHRIMVY